MAGEIGNGKTTLLQDAAERASMARMHVLRARGIEWESAVPIRPIPHAPAHEFARERGYMRVRSLA